MSGQVGASQTGGRLLLLARSAMFATVSVGLAGGAHLQSGGERPGLLVYLVAVVILTQLVMLLGLRERGWFPIAALLLLTQLVLHPLFEAFPAHPHSAAEHSPPVVGAAGTSWQMELAHAAAALVAAWWLRRGEARVRQLAGGTVAATCRPLRAALAAAGAAPAARPVVATVRPDGRVAVLAWWDQGTPVGRRGPPTGRVALSG